MEEETFKQILSDLSLSNLEKGFDELDLTLVQKKELIKAYDLKALQYAAENKHHHPFHSYDDILQVVENDLGYQKGYWDYYEVIRYATINGHVKAIEEVLGALTSSEKQDAIRSYNFSSIKCAAENGHEKILQLLLNLLPKELKQEAIQADDYAAIRGATENGHLEVVKYLLDSLPEAEKNSLIQADDYAAIRGAAENAYSVDFATPFRFYSPGHSTTIRHPIPF
ncbi:MAG: ankyrin repeat domain-containing protein [Legionella sp.]|nr:ankyrin repeat domain-containing protein [Legionella sp.]